MAVRLVADEPDVAAVRRERGARLVAEARHERRQHPAAEDARIAARHEPSDAERDVALAHAGTAVDGVDVIDDRRRPPGLPIAGCATWTAPGRTTSGLGRGRIVRSVLDEHLAQRPAPRKRDVAPVGDHAEVEQEARRRVHHLVAGEDEPACDERHLGREVAKASHEQAVPLRPGRDERAVRADHRRRRVVGGGLDGVEQVQRLAGRDVRGDDPIRPRGSRPALERQAAAVLRKCSGGPRRPACSRSPAGPAECPCSRRSAPRRRPSDRARPRAPRRRRRRARAPRRGPRARCPAKPCACGDSRRTSAARQLREASGPFAADGPSPGGPPRQVRPRDLRDDVAVDHAGVVPLGVLQVRSLDHAGERDVGRVDDLAHGREVSTDWCSA